MTRIIFLGTPDFAVASLRALVENNCRVVAVVTAPDRPAGRGQLLQQSAVKKFAVEHDIPVLQPEKLKDVDFLKQLKAFKADLQIVVAFRMLPEIVWNMPDLGTYNLHASLLPNYRGAAPINWAIIRGERTTGVTTFKLRHEIDAGNIVFQEEVAIAPDDDAGSLHDKLMNVGAGLIVKTVRVIEQTKNGSLPFVIQKEELVTHAPKIFKETCRINWAETASNIQNLVRGLSPAPGAYTTLFDAEGATKVVKIFRAKMVDGDHSPHNGSLLTDNKSFLRVQCGKGILELDELQLEGKKRMDVRSFLLGQRLTNCRFA